MDRFWKALNNRCSRLFISACLAALLLTACQNPAQLAATLPQSLVTSPPALPPTSAPLPAGLTSIKLGQPFTLAPAQEALLPDADLHLRFEHVLEDSRCPRLVACVWSGQVRVEIMVWSGSDKPVLLEFSPETRPPVTTNIHFLKGLTIQLMAVDPYPDSPDTPIPPENYRLTLVIQ